MWYIVGGHDWIQNHATNAYLAERGFKAGLEPYANYSRRRDTKMNPYKMATMVEALLAAVHIDSKSVAIVKRSMVGLGLIRGDLEKDCSREDSFGDSGERSEKPFMSDSVKSRMLSVEVEAVGPGGVPDMSAEVEKVTVSEPRTPANTTLEVKVVEPTRVLEIGFGDSVLPSDVEPVATTVLEIVETPHQAAQIDLRVKNVVTQPNGSVLASQEPQPYMKEKKKSKVRRLKEEGLGWLAKRFKKQSALKT